MLSSLRTRLIGICVSIVIFSMLALALGNFLTTRRHMLESMDDQILQLSRSHSASIAEWMRSKQSVVSSIVQAADVPDPLPLAGVVGTFKLN